MTRIIDPNYGVRFEGDWYVVCFCYLMPDRKPPISPITVLGSNFHVQFAPTPERHIEVVTTMYILSSDFPERFLLYFLLVAALPQRKGIKNIPYRKKAYQIPLVCLIN